MDGVEMHDFARRLFPLNRSITGDGVRQTLSIIKDQLPNLSIVEVPSGTKAFDWTVPQEWRVNSATLIDPNGNCILDFDTCNLNLVGYSNSFFGKIALNELQNRLYSLPEQPTAIPYVTSYYSDHWGFCMSQIQRDSLVDGLYEVSIDTNKFNGFLTYGEIIIAGETSEEILLSTYICHPSLANNEISGPVVLTAISKWIESLQKRKYTYRIIFIPETIGSLVYLSRNLSHLKNKVIAGFNLTCIGDDRAYSFLPSRNGQTISDKIGRHVLSNIDGNFIEYTWLERGSDERQFCAPGIDLPIATIMRTKYGEYPEYHTSLDNLDEVVTAQGLQGGLNAVQKSIEVLENNSFPKVTVLGEPQLGKRGLYPSLSIKGSGVSVRNMMNLITFSDGTLNLLEIAMKMGVPVWELYETIEILVSAKLITLNSNRSDYHLNS